MRTWIESLAACLLLAAPVVCCAAEDDSPQAPPGEALVEAKVIGPARGAAEGYSSVEVTHVFYGRNDLVGKRFEVQSGAETRWGQFGIIEAISPGLQRGEIGIWLLTDLGDSSFAPIERGGEFGWGFPVRDVLSPRYAEVRKLGEAVEQFHKKPEGEQEASLLKLASDPSDEIAGWALNALANRNPTLVKRLWSDPAAQAKLVAGAQLELDRFFQFADRDRWLGSASRLKLLQRLAASKLREHQGDALVDLLYESRGDGPWRIPTDQLFLLCREAGAHAQVSASGAEMLTGIVAALGCESARKVTAETHRDAYKLLLEWLRQKDKTICLVAAERLGVSGRDGCWDASQLSLLREAARGIKDPEILNALEPAFHPLPPPPRQDRK